MSCRGTARPVDRRPRRVTRAPQNRLSRTVRYNSTALKSWSAEIQSPEGDRLDVTLIERIAAREASAVGDLYDRHSRLLYGLILRILRDRSEADEILQDVFVTVWNRAETYKVALGSPAAWLVRIARNKAIDRLRANTARMRAVESAPLELQASGNPEVSALLGEQQRVVARALQAIPRDQRDLIEEAYYLGRTQSELAERYKLPLGTVKTRIRTGLLMLRQQLLQESVQS
jgi:RNA polymerase sigma-70 factor (ECF subfamily)